VADEAMLNKIPKNKYKNPSFEKKKIKRSK
jgi:hypothetical protein